MTTVHHMEFLATALALDLRADHPLTIHLEIEDAV